MAHPTSSQPGSLPGLSIPLTLGAALRASLSLPFPRWDMLPGQETGQEEGSCSHTPHEVFTVPTATITPLQGRQEPGFIVPAGHAACSAPHLVLRPPPSPGAERGSCRKYLGHSRGLTGRWKKKQMWSRCGARTVFDLQYS